MTTRSSTYFRPHVSRDGEWVPFSKKAWEVLDDARTNAHELVAGGEASILIRQQVVTVDETDVETVTT